MFKPLTLRVLFEACSALGATVDDAFDDPTRIVDDDIGPGESQAFLDCVLADPPTIMDEPPEKAHAAIAEAVGGFFCSHLPGSLQRAEKFMTPIWEKQTGVPEPKGSVAFMRAVAYAPFGDYRELMDAPLEDALVFLNLRSINAALDD